MFGVNLVMDWPDMPHLATLRHILHFRYIHISYHYHRITVLWTTLQVIISHVKTSTDDKIKWSMTKSKCYAKCAKYHTIMFYSVETLRLKTWLVVVYIGNRHPVIIITYMYKINIVLKWFLTDSFYLRHIFNFLSGLVVEHQVLHHCSVR